MRVVVADGAVLAREQLAALLDRAGVTVPACVGTAEELLRAIPASRPDLVVTDATLPAGGLPPDGARPPTDRGRPGAGSDPPLVRVRRRHPGTPLLVLAASPAAGDPRALVEHGVRGFGYLVRCRVAGGSALVEAAALVAAGGSAIDPEVVAGLLAPAAGPLAALSGRERDVLALLADGRTNAAIAAHLWLTPRTVEGHVRSIFGKLRLPATPDDHRRVLAARVYLAETQGPAT